MLEYMALVVLEPTAFPLKPGTPRISSVPNFMAILRSAFGTLVRVLKRRRRCTSLKSDTSASHGESVARVRRASSISADLSGYR